MPVYRRTESFKSDFKEVTKDNEILEKEVIKAFKLFQENPYHPSLRIKRMQGYENIWEGHITQKYVFTFHKEKSVDGETIYWFRRMGDHTIYDNP
jgi:mRNA interferase RelE/StbE